MVPNKEEHHHTGPSNGQESWILTRIWQSVLAAHNNRIEDYFRGIPETRTTLFYVPAWQPEAPQYLNQTNGDLPVSFRIRLGIKFRLIELERKLAKAEAA